MPPRLLPDPAHLRLEYLRANEIYQRLEAERNTAASIWKKNVTDAKRKLEDLPHERDAFMKDLNNRRRVTHDYQLYNLAAIEIDGLGMDIEYRSVPVVETA
jgi:hypothetical protein